MHLVLFFQVVSLPDGYQAVVLQAGRGQGLGERQDKTMRAVDKVDQITVWNYDKVPSEQDQFRKALEWVKLAEVLHEEEDDDDGNSDN